eukprot:COSAG06_NODE_3298_length_5538_cov_3.853833_7_plen_92_part_00
MWTWVGWTESKKILTFWVDSCVGAMCCECDLLTQIRGVAVFRKPPHPHGRFRRMGPLGPGWPFPGNPAAQVAVSGGEGRSPVLHVRVRYGL